jgi:hypothetical protein
MTIDATKYYKPVYGSTQLTTSPAAQAIPEMIDANGDGIQDILVFGAYYPFNGSNPVAQAATLLLGKGDGTYTVGNSALSALTTVHPREMVRGDFNGDGKEDFFIADHGYDALPFPGAQNKLLLSSPNGYVDASANLPQIADFTHSAAVGDVNGDGKLDIFVGNLSGPSSPAQPYFLLGDGTGHFTKSDAGLPVGTGGLLNRNTDQYGATASLLADLNGDGRDDLVLGNDGNTYGKEHRSAVFWNTGSGFSATSMSYLPQGFYGDYRIVHDIAAVDLDGDGDKDLILLSSESRPMEAYGDGWAIDTLRNDKGTFVDDTASHFANADRFEGQPNEISKIGASEFIRMLDVNGDGHQDLVITQFMNNPPTANTPVVWTNDGFGHFEVAVRAGQMATLSGNPSFIGTFTLPYASANGYSFSTFHNDKGTVYTATLEAQKMLPGSVAITATASNDTIRQNAANNTIEGGGGRDTLVYGKAASNYTIAAATGGFTVTDKTAADGVDTLAHVERIAFSDKALALDIDGAAGQAYRIYRAAFDRAPDSAGLGFWISALDKGYSINAMASGFIDSKEFRDLYGTNPSNEAVLTALYKNVLHRTPDAAGYEFWMGAMAKGYTVQELLVYFSEGSENQAQVVGQIQNGIEFTPYG